MMVFNIHSESDMEKVLAYIATIPIAGECVVEIRKMDKRRSNRQNRTMWMWLGVLSKDLGYSPEELHEILKMRFLGYEEVFVSEMLGGRCNT